MSAKRTHRLTYPIVGTVLAGVGAFTYRQYRRDLCAARARISSGSRLVNTPSGPIEYAVAGNGPPILLIHGAGGGFDQGLQMGRGLIASGFRVIAMSRFGYLRTPLPTDASPMAQANAHRCLLDALNVSRVAVLGGSAGAPSALQFCLRYPERCSALVLQVPMAFAPPDDGNRPMIPSASMQILMNTILHSDFSFWIMTKLARDKVLRTILATPPSDFKKATPDEQARVLAIMRNILPISARATGLLNQAAVLRDLPRYELERITVPTLILTIENDLYGSFRSARYTADHIPGARFVSYPTGGHLWVGHEQDFVSQISDFVGKHANVEYAVAR